MSEEGKGKHFLAPVGRVINRTLDVGAKVVQEVEDSRFGTFWAHRLTPALRRMSLGTAVWLGAVLDFIDHGTSAFYSDRGLTQLASMVGVYAGCSYLYSSGPVRSLRRTYNLRGIRADACRLATTTQNGAAVDLTLSAERGVHGVSIRIPVPAVDPVTGNMRRRRNRAYSRLESHWRGYVKASNLASGETLTAGVHATPEFPEVTISRGMASASASRDIAA